MALLLAPGGCPAAVEAAVSAGADGVYCGLPKLSRAVGTGLTRLELAGCLDFVHRRGRFLHLAANAVPGHRDLPAFQSSLAECATLGIDAAIVNDPGLIAWARRELPGLPVYASVGLAALNREDIRFYGDLGVAGVVCPPGTAPGTLSLVSGPGLEVFCDLAVEPLVTGRCALSSYTRPGPAKADTPEPADQVKRGAVCRQPCRLPWAYEDGDGAGGYQSLRSPFTWRRYRMEDMVPYLRAGVTLFKIQGRRLSPPAVAGLVDRYRRLLDQARQQVERNEQISRTSN